MWNPENEPLKQEMNRPCCNLCNSTIYVAFLIPMTQDAILWKQCLNQGDFMINWQSSWNNHYNPRIQCKTPTFFTLQLLFFHLLPQGFSCRYNWSHYISTEAMHTLFHKKRNPSKIVFPFFGSVISPNLPRSLSTDPCKFNRKNHQKNGEKKRRAFQLSQWVHWEKMAPVEISSSKRWQERSKPHFQGELFQLKFSDLRGKMFGETASNRGKW